MIIEFNSNRTKKLCSKAKKARKKYGKKTQEKLFRRIYELQAFECLEEVPPYNPFRRHKLKGEYKNCFAVDINGSYRLVFEPVIDTERNIEDVPLTEIKKINILGVYDYHD